jgi:hypothetical protein
VTGVLLTSAILIHCVCMFTQTTKERSFFRSVTENQGNTTTVGENGNIVPKVEYMKESLSNQPDRQENTKYDTLPLKPGYQHTNQVLPLCHFIALDEMGSWTEQIMTHTSLREILHVCCRDFSTTCIFCYTLDYMN